MKISVIDTRLAVVLLMAGAVSAPGCVDHPRRSGGPDGGPPPQAIEACAARMSNDACYFEDGAHAITGSCQQRGNDWVCVPDREPPGTHAGHSGTAADHSNPNRQDMPPVPPPEALEACVGLGIGAACSVLTSRGSISGRCSGSADMLVCIPSDPSHRPVSSF